MSEAHSTAPGKPSKPAKPYPEFALTYHPAGYWCKKIRGKLHYFGPRFDPTDPAAAAAAADAALVDYNRQADDLHAGRKPRPDADAATVKDVANAFLNHKSDKRDAGELSPRTWLKYKQVTDLLVGHLGKSRLVADLGPDDFTGLKKKMSQRWGHLRVRDFIQHIRSVFKYAVDAELIDRPVRFGPGFARPSKKTMRLERARKGPRMFEAEEIRRMLNATGTPLKAMILLGVNCGFGNADCGTLPQTALDLDGGWVNHHRSKTGITRRCPLWPETVQALREALAARPEPKQPEHAGLVFLTSRGGSWHKQTDDSPVSKETSKLLRRLHINGRKGFGFYTLRHVLETIGGEAKDQVAVDHIMGHARDDMASIYRERISDERLRAVAEHVRTWLFGEETKTDAEASSEEE
jgi:integrase